ncbi:MULTISPECIES: hypothetical protein [Emticicia]|uniref:hypothetical protein n=1 Tax=Emticicia TaxID=312278 RepID=UPI00209DAA36|nr:MULTISPECIES: hypothetical protein [Emticicia]UTA69483.1 hypothetical protein MB380_06650 [Emticicia sp. 21SJ11W-3]
MNKILLFFAAIAVMGCSSKNPKDNPVLVEANEVHMQAEAIQEQVEPEIDKLDSLSNLLLAKKTLKADSLARELTTLKADFNTWEKNFFAVPGFEHTHESGHEHEHHHHNSVPDLPAEKMLEVQKEIKQNIEQIKTRLESISVAVKQL